MNAYLDILIFAVIAGVLLFRLRSVLGQRSDEDPAPLRHPLTENKTDAKPGAAKDVTGTAEFVDVPHASERWSQGLPDFKVVANATTHNRLAQFLAFDPSFRPDEFQDKARKAYGMIVKAFSEGNRNTLEFLLAPDLFRSFIRQIETREQNRETYYSTLHGIRSLILSDADLNGSVARITVDVVAEQDITHKDASGLILNGMDGRRQVTKDRWVFEKDLKNPSPSWLLVDTQEHDE